MNPVAVGAFHDQIVGRRQRLGIANDGQSATAQVARETQPDLFPARLQLQEHGCRSEDMPGFERLINDAGANLSGRVHRDRVEERKGGLGVLGCIERLDGRADRGAGKVQRSAPQIPLVQERGIVFLQRRRIFQHGAA